MLTDNNLKIAKEWVIKSQNDLKSAEILFRENGPTDSLCFHCHQAVEKILKGFLVFNKKEFPKVHDLIHLLNLCKKLDKNLEKLEKDVSFLNRYYIETRYPPEVIAYSKKECKKSLEVTQKTTQFIIGKILK
jgi:HEPN domain-containing protein